MIKWFRTFKRLVEINDRLREVENRVFAPVNACTPDTYLRRDSGVTCYVYVYGEKIGLPLDEVLQAILDHLDVKVVPAYQQPHPRTKLQSNAKPEPGPENEG